MEPLRVETMVVRAGRIECELRIEGPCRYTTPAIARALLARYPTLQEHACVNEKGTTFGSVIDNTSLAHLLEHLVIDLQTRADGEEGESFTGTTEWIDEASGRALVQVSFADDLVALRAFRDAITQINETVLQ